MFEKLKTSLSTDSKRAITVGFAVGDAETITFASQLIFTLRESNWDVTPVGHWYESQFVPGLRVLGTDTDSKNLLKKALTDAQIPYNEEPVPVPGMFHGGTPDETILFLYIGTKPPPKF